MLGMYFHFWQHFFASSQKKPQRTLGKTRQKNAWRATRSAKLLCLTVLFVGVVYLVQVNALATKGYAIKELKGRIAHQKKETEKLQFEIIEARSLHALHAQIDSLRLVRSSGQIEYLHTAAQPVAIR